MAEQQKDWTLPYRHDTVRKHIRLRPEARDRIQAWANKNQTSFSAAIEGLALAGMENATLESIASFLVLTVDRAFMRNFNRFAKLVVHAGLEAGAAKHTAQAVFFLHLLELAAETDDPARLSERLGIDPDTPWARKWCGCTGSARAASAGGR
jgi:hypothetical protein